MVPGLGVAGKGCEQGGEWRWGVRGALGSIEQAWRAAAAAPWVPAGLPNQLVPLQHAHRLHLRAPNPTALDSRTGRAAGLLWLNCGAQH